MHAEKGKWLCNHQLKQAASSYPCIVQMFDVQQACTLGIHECLCSHYLLAQCGLAQHTTVTPQYPTSVQDHSKPNTHVIINLKL